MQAIPVVTLGGKPQPVVGDHRRGLVIFMMRLGSRWWKRGFCRAKHAAHVVSTNFAIFGLGFIGFFLVGFPLAFSAWDVSGYFGGDIGIAVGSHGRIGQRIFCSRRLAMSGGGDRRRRLACSLHGRLHGHHRDDSHRGVAERWKWGSFVIGASSAARSTTRCSRRGPGAGLAGEGQWDTMSLGAGYVDCQRLGCGAHVGGARRIAGSIVLGPRIGKFGADGKPRGTPVTTSRWRCSARSYCCSAGSASNAAATLAATDVQFAVVAANTAIAGAFGAITAMLWITKRTGKPDPGMMANGMLAGLVAITAPCAFVSPAMAMVIGIIAGVLVIEAVFFVERKLKVDDPVGAIAVHGVNGTFGVLAVGLFANGSYGAAWNGSDVEGVQGPLWAMPPVRRPVLSCGSRRLSSRRLAFFKIQDRSRSPVARAGSARRRPTRSPVCDIPRGRARVPDRAHN